MRFDRRTFLRGAAGVSMAAAFESCSRKPFIPVPPLPGLPNPATSGIEHIVVVTMENRSFDHFFGWLPNANGIPPGLTYPDAHSTQHPVHPLAPDYTGCGHPDPDHSYTGARTYYANGAMNGFLLDTNNDEYCIGYYTASDIPFYAALAQAYTAYDNWHASILGPTFPNRMFLWAAQTDRITDSILFTNLPTIFDALGAANVSHRYYFSNIPYVAFWGLKYVFSTGFFANFLSDAKSGTLPAVSFVDPIYTVLDDGTGNDNHPHADIRNGDAFLSQVLNALASGPKWANTVLVITFDEWGGLFEHVAPPRVVAPANSPDKDLQNGAALLGFRVPAVIASPFTRSLAGQPNLVDHKLYDHTAALKLIEWRFGLPPLTARDASSAINNPVASFNFTSPIAAVPALPQVSKVSVPPCFGGIFSADPSTVEGKASSAKTSLGTRANSWTALAGSPLVKDFMAHPHIQSLPKQ